MFLTNDEVLLNFNFQVRLRTHAALGLSGHTVLRLCGIRFCLLMVHGAKNKVSVGAMAQLGSMFLKKTSTATILLGYTALILSLRL